MNLAQKLHKGYFMKQPYDFVGFFCYVTIEWE